VTIIHTIVLGIIEGLTEFLPVSSTFHLIFSAHILGLMQNDFTKLFEVFIQSGAILAVVFLYYKTFITDKELLKKTCIAFLPTAIIGFAFYKIIKNVFFESNVLMLSVFIGVGILFILYEWIIVKKKISLDRSLETFTFKEAILIGFFQSFAIIPGVSRAGAVILGMMFLKFRRDESAKFSFLLSVPTLFAASFLDLIKMRQIVFSSGNNMLLLGVGFFVSFIVAYIVIKWFIGYLQNHSLVLFGGYRVIAGLILFLFRVK